MIWKKVRSSDGLQFGRAVVVCRCCGLNRSLADDILLGGEVDSEGNYYCTEFIERTARLKYSKIYQSTVEKMRGYFIHV
jgi:hypothetical protein